MIDENHRKAAVNTAKKKAVERQDKIVTVEGVRVKVHGVSSSLIQEVTSKISDPQPPIVPNPDKDGRPEPNPFDPTYLRDLELAQDARNIAASDTLAMFGFELLDGLPPDEGWIRKLKFLEKKGAIDLTEYDLEDPFEKEFLFKKYIVSSGANILLVTRASGTVSAEEVAQAEESFPSKEAR